jgi:lysozyme family protein
MSIFKNILDFFKPPKSESNLEHVYPPREWPNEYVDKAHTIVVDDKQKWPKRVVVLNMIKNIENGMIFSKALELILKNEGGYVNKPEDKGGPTNKGITQRAYDYYRKSKTFNPQSVELITDYEVSEIYYKSYWMEGDCDKLPDKLNIVHFDTCVNCGCRQASKFLQRAVNAVDDGVIGNRTIDMVNNYISTYGVNYIITEYLKERSEFYYALVEKDPSQKVFIKGWQNRIENLKSYIDGVKP